MGHRDATGNLSGAEYLASIYGTEKDKVNCSFFFKIGACRHGDKCSRAHHKPSFSNTVLLKNFYHSPVVDVRQADAFDKVGKPNAEEQSFFDEFYEEVFAQLEEAYGQLEELNVCENIGEHMVGNVYAKFVREEDAERAVEGLENRWFNGEPIYAELSPVSDFREARCRQHEISTCTKGGFCNFMHLKSVSDRMYDQLYGSKGGRYKSSRRHDRFYADDGWDRRGGSGGGGGGRDRYGGGGGGGGGGGRYGWAGGRRAVVVVVEVEDDTIALTAATTTAETEAIAEVEAEAATTVVGAESDVATTRRRIAIELFCTTRYLSANFDQTLALTYTV